MPCRILFANIQEAQTHVRCVSSATDSLTESNNFSADTVSTGSLDSIQAANAPDGFVGTAMNLIDGFHSATGLPWWATLSVTAIGSTNVPA